MQQTEIAARQFGSVAADYLTSTVHAQGTDLTELAAMVKSQPHARVLDLGCGAGHASYAVAPHAAEVVAYDVATAMLDVVRQTAGQRALANIHVRRGAAEKLPFDDASFDIIVSRLSAHHWRDVRAAVGETKRVLKKQGTVVIIDSAGARDPLCDSHLQAIEVLRDRSHVRNYSPAEWQSFLTAAGFDTTTPKTWRIHIELANWVARMRTPEVRINAILDLWEHAPAEVREYYRVQPDGSFDLEVMKIAAVG